MQHSTRVQSMKSMGPHTLERQGWAVAGVASVLAIMAMPAWSAVEQARVISRTPVLEQVLVPRDVCRDETATVQPAKSGAGAAVGAIAGGVLGNQIGDGSGRVIATTVGAIGGAVIGNHLEPAPATRVITTRRCITEQVIEQRIAGYDVVYELGGKQYQARLDRDPGDTLAVEIAPIQSSAAVTTPIRSSQSGQWVTAPIQASRWVTAPVGVQYVYVDYRGGRGYRDHGYRDGRYRDPWHRDRDRDRDRRKYRHGD